MYSRGMSHLNAAYCHNGELYIKFFRFWCPCFSRKTNRFIFAIFSLVFVARGVQLACVYWCFSGEGYYANQDDELIFEDFARLRLKGLEGDDTEAWTMCTVLSLCSSSPNPHYLATMDCKEKSFFCKILAGKWLKYSSWAFKVFKNG